MHEIVKSRTDDVLEIMFNHLNAKAESKVFKSIVVSSIVNWVHKESPNGGFVKKMNDGRWCEVGDNLAREKVAQSFRDLLHDQYKSSTKSKRQRRKLQEQQQRKERENHTAQQRIKMEEIAPAE